MYGKILRKLKEDLEFLTLLDSDELTMAREIELYGYYKTLDSEVIRDYCNNAINHCFVADVIGASIARVISETSGKEYVYVSGPNVQIKDKRFPKDSINITNFRMPRIIPKEKLKTIHSDSIIPVQIQQYVDDSTECILGYSPSDREDEVVCLTPTPHGLKPYTYGKHEEEVEPFVEALAWQQSINGVMDSDSIKEFTDTYLSSRVNNNKENSKSIGKCN